MFQTASSQAQEIERQIQRVWSAYRLNPSAHANALPLLSRFAEIAAEGARRPLSFDDRQGSTDRCSSWAAPSAAGGRSSR